MVETVLPTISDFIPEIVCLGVDCIVCGIVYTAYVFTNRAITSVCSAAKFDLDKQAHDVQSLRDEILAHPNATVNKEGEKCIPYAVIRGEIQPVSKSLNILSEQSDIGHKNISLHNRDGVIQQFAIIEHKKTMSRAGFWYDSERVIHEYTNYVPFYILPQGLTTKGLFATKLSDTNCRKVEVFDWSDATRLDLDVIRDSFESAPNTLSDNVWGWIVGDRPKGFQTTEKMLLTGTPLTAIGELAISKENSGIKMQAPSTGENYYLVKDTSKALIKDLEKSSQILRNTLFFFGGLGLVIVSVAAYRYMKRVRLVQEANRVRTELQEIIQARQERIRLDESSATSNREMNILNSDESQGETSSPQNSPASDEEQGNGASVSPQTCVVCLSENREVILMNCGHVCVCAGCAMEIMATRPICPICRATIDRVAPAFIA